jgi:glycine/D-amino acid oxidase-like deaminating enzyme
VTGLIAGGLWSEREARVDNRALGRALAVAFQKQGGVLKSNEAVVRIERRGGGAAIARTPYAAYGADAFVLAAGAWSGLVEESLAPIAPVKGQIVFLAPPGEVTIPSCVIWCHGVYLVPRENGLMIGATAEDAGFDTTVTEEARESLISAAAKLIPDVRNWRVEDQWAGLRPKAPDALPLLGPTAVEGLWLAGGQYRNGILFAPAVAETMAQQILGTATAIPAFDPRRFQQ